MKNILLPAIVSLLLAVNAAAAGKTNGVVAGISAGGGYTAVDFEKASGYSDDYLEDWGQGHFKATLYCLVPIAPRLSAGGEIGYHDLYWWYYRIPYGPFSPVYREAEWSTMSLLALLRKETGGALFVQAGAGFHFFDGDPAFALSAALGVTPRIKGIAIPLVFRIDPIFGAGFPITIALGAGLEFPVRTSK